MKKQCAINRFLSKIKRAEDGCHLWIGTMHKKTGFGVFGLNGKYHQAHRVAYSFFVGDPSDGRVLRKCGNNICVNPDHLFLRRDLKPEVESLLKNGRDRKEISSLTGLSLSTVYRYLREK